MSSLLSIFLLATCVYTQEKSVATLNDRVSQSSTDQTIQLKLTNAEQVNASLSCYRYKTLSEGTSAEIKHTRIFPCPSFRFCDGLDNDCDGTPTALHEAISSALF
eukprot:710215_1